MTVCDPDHTLWAHTLVHSRRTTLPKRLKGPGPDASQKQQILHAAGAAPDHEQLLPWRFIELPAEARSRLGEAFAQALRERDPQATAEEQAQAHDKALRSPWLLVLVVRTGGAPDEIPAAERLLSAGAAVQNMLLLCTALGLGSSLTSGKALSSTPLRRLLQLDAQEQAICFVNVGHVDTPRPARARPEVARYFSVLGTR
ncbi:MAG: nitroreductase [Betaproteobacteria bacterium]|nr:nitroreductase [Betaproteobacteria bacterium]